MEFINLLYTLLKLDLKASKQQNNTTATDVCLHVLLDKQLINTHSI